MTRRPGPRSPCSRRGRRPARPACDGERGGGRVSGALVLFEFSECPRCKVSAREEWRPFLSASALALSILAETALAQVPELPAPSKGWLPAAGRRLLAF